MGTKLELDTPQLYLKERGISYQRSAASLTRHNDKYRVKYWPSSESITLYPINLTPDFSADKTYDYLKFRLSDCIYDGDWWTEVPEGKDNQSDYFFHTVVKAKNYAGPGQDMLTNLRNNPGGLQLPALAQLENAKAVSGVDALQSTATLPENTGYELRFRFEGRSTSVRPEIFTFFFGEYSLVIDSNGEAHLWKTEAFKSYSYVYSFRWHPQWHSQGYGSVYRILIIPHAQRFIDFHVDYIDKDWHDWAKELYLWKAKKGAGIGGSYRLNGQLPKLPNGENVITKSAPWTLRLSKEYKAFIQVSRLAFFSGVTSPAIFWDKGQDIGFVPTNQIWYHTQHDLNGGKINYTYFDGATFLGGGLVPFQSGNAQQCPALQVQMTGINDLGGSAGTLKSSSRSPEFYGYGIDKAPIFEISDTTPQLFETLAHRIYSGDEPERFRLNVAIDNSKGQAANYVERGYAACRLIDDESGLTYFEGFAVQNEGGEAPSAEPEKLVFDCVSQADRFLRSHAFGLNFTQDPFDTAKVKRPWFWQDALKRCCESVGYDPKLQVVFDPVYYQGQWTDASRWNFRLWAEGDGGGPKNGEKEGPNKRADIWFIDPRVPLYQWVNDLIKNILGWHWVWDLGDHAWHVYKRPTPEQTLATPVKAAFFKDDASFRAARSDPKYDGIPLYKHANLKRKPKGPSYTTLMVITNADLFADVPLKLLSDLINGSVDQSQLNYYEAFSQVGNDLVSRVWTNINGYPNPLNPNPDVSHPDYMGQQHIKVVPLLNCPSKDAFEWIGRLAFEDLCFGYQWRNFDADWGDEFTYRLRKWDPIYIDGELWLIDEIEANWVNDWDKRANYNATKFRPDAHPPR